jgi:hypothetical protein
VDGLAHWQCDGVRRHLAHRARVRHLRHVPDGRGGDLGPEGLTIVPADESPNGKPLLIVDNEVSGTTAIFRINPR